MQTRLSSPSGAASREQMAYNIDTSKATVPEALEILTDAVLNPKFQSWEVAEQVGVGVGVGVAVGLRGTCTFLHSLATAYLKPLPASVPPPPLAPPWPRCARWRLT